MQKWNDWEIKCHRHNNSRLMTLNFWKFLSRSLKCHLQDLKNDASLLSSHIICISDSWLSKQDQDNSLQIPGSYMYRKDRRDSYKNHECSKEICKKCNHKGGVSMYVNNTIQSEIIGSSDQDSSEMLSLKSSTMKCHRSQLFPFIDQIMSKWHLWKILCN